MNVLLRDADDQNLRLIKCIEAYVWSDRSVLLFRVEKAVPEQGLDHVIPLEEKPDGLYAKTADGATERNVNDILKELYENGKIDMSDYDSYYSGDDKYLDIICGDMSDPTI